MLLSAAIIRRFFSFLLTFLVEKRELTSGQRRRALQVEHLLPVRRLLLGLLLLLLPLLLLPLLLLPPPGIRSSWPPATSPRLSPAER
jgi:hypothetical protein